MTSNASSVVAGIAVLALAVTTVRAENLVTVRGAYFREPSTRVVQPMVEIAKDLPGQVEIRANYLLDAISSASMSAGVVGDNIFSEFRNDVGLGASKRFDLTQVSLGYHYSAESDYWSHTVSAAVARRLWGDTGLLQISGGGGFDSMRSRGARTPNCRGPGNLTCYLFVYFGGVSYSQVITPRLVAQVSAEASYLSGFQANLYRSAPSGYEMLPDTRLRVAVAPRVAYYFPEVALGLQAHYRYYRDSWSVGSHTVEGRVYKALTPNLELRLSYRHYFQTPADFWCDWIAHPDCYAADAAYTPADPKLAHVTTRMPEAKLMWEAAALQGVPFFGWFAAGTFEISYARYFQNNPMLGNAHLLQAGYSMPY